MVLQGLGGDDTFTVDPEVWNQDGMFVTVLGGDPGDSDVLLVDHSLGLNDRNYSVDYPPGVADDAGVVAENANGFLDFAGIEKLQLVGNGVGDKLQLNDDFGDNVWQIGPGPAVFGDSVRSQIDARTPVDFQDFDLVVFNNSAGVDRFVVSPDRLPVDGNPTDVDYRIDGVLVGNPPRARDVLEIRGTGYNDVVFVTDTTVTLGVAMEYLDIATLVVATGEGDDRLQVDASAAVVTTPVMFDGGTGSDLLQVKDATGARYLRSGRSTRPVRRSPRGGCSIGTMTPILRRSIGWSSTLPTSSRSRTTCRSPP